jgi:hypothetical protein
VKQERIRRAISRREFLGLEAITASSILLYSASHLGCDKARSILRNRVSLIIGFEDEVIPQIAAWLSRQHGDFYKLRSIMTI